MGKSASPAAPPPPPRPDAPAAKTLLGSEDSPISAAKKRAAQRSSLTATYLTAPTPGVGVQL
jgi:hypothetical protein